MNDVDLVDQLPVDIFIINKKLELQYCNTAFENMVEMKADYLFGKT